MPMGILGICIISKENHHDKNKILYPESIDEINFIPYSYKKNTYNLLVSKYKIRYIANPNKLE